MNLKSVVLKIAEKDPKIRRILLSHFQELEARYTKGIPVPLENLPEEFQDMNQNPPESVLKVREQMMKKSNQTNFFFTDLTDQLIFDKPSNILLKVMSVSKTLLELRFEYKESPNLVVVVEEKGSFTIVSFILNNPQYSHFIDVPKGFKVHEDMELHEVSDLILSKVEKFFKENPTAPEMGKRIPPRHPRSRRAAKPVKKLTGKKLDALINTAYKTHGNMIQIPIFDLSKVYNSAKEAYEKASAEEAEEKMVEALKNAINKYKVGSNKQSPLSLRRDYGKVKQAASEIGWGDLSPQADKEVKQIIKLFKLRNPVFFSGIHGLIMDASVGSGPNSKITLRELSYLFSTSFRWVEINFSKILLENELDWHNVIQDILGYPISKSTRTSKGTLFEIVPTSRRISREDFKKILRTSLVWMNKGKEFGIGLELQGTDWGN